MRTSRRLAILATVVLGMALSMASPGPAAADILPVNSNPTISNLGGGQYRYTWGIQVTGSQRVELNDFFTLYDLAGYVNNSALTPNANWIFSQQATGTTPVGTAPNDSASLQNVTFTYCGPSPLVGPQIIGNFSIVSTIPTAQFQLRNFAGRGTDQNTGLKNANLTNIATPSATPEPGTLILVGTGLVGLVARSRRRRADALTVAWYRVKDRGGPGLGLPS